MDNIRELKIKKRLYIELASVINDIRKYGYNEMDTEEFVHNAMYYNKLYPLPSGNVGNILAVALETNYYVAAKCIMDHNDEIGLDLNIIAYDNKEILDFDEVFEYSKLTKMTKEDLEQIQAIDGFTKTKRFLYRNEMAYLQICDSMNKSKGKSL